jgi:hypothetical protein
MKAYHKDMQVVPPYDVSRVFKTITSIHIDTNNITSDADLALQFLKKDPHSHAAVCKVAAASISNDIPFHGDVLVGFLTKDAAVSFDLLYGENDDVLCSYNLSPNQFTFAVEARYVLPLLYTAFTQFRLSVREGNADDLFFVYGLFHDDIRQIMAPKCFAVKLQQQGMFMVFSEDFIRITEHVEDNTYMLPKCNYDHQVYTLDTLRKAISFSPPSAIQTIHLVHRDTRCNVVATRQILQGIVDVNEMNLPTSVISVIRCVLEDSYKELIEILAYIEQDPNGVHHLFESVKMMCNDDMQNTTDSIRRLIDDPSLRYTIFRSAATNPEIPKYGDVVLGFEALSPVSFDITVKNKVICSYTLAKGKFTYAIDNKYPILLLCTRYDPYEIVVREGALDDIDVVYGLLQNNDRRVLARHRFVMNVRDMYLWYHSGHIEIFDRAPLPHRRCIQFPVLDDRQSP